MLGFTNIVKKILKTASRLYFAITLSIINGFSCLICQSAVEFYQQCDDMIYLTVKLILTKIHSYIKLYSYRKYVMCL